MPRYSHLYGAEEDIILGHDSDLACVSINPDGKSWRLIRLDDEADIKVNSEDLHLVYYLSVGDRIDINGEAWRFAAPKDTQDHEYVRFKHLSVVSAISVAILAAVIFVVSYNIISRQPIHSDEINDYKGSICKFSVVRLVYQQVEITADTVCVETLEMLPMDGNSIAATGFISTDGYFVTARHCVEPWIKENDPLASDDPAVRWAIETENFNVYESTTDSLYRRIIAECEVYDKNKEVIHTFLTDTCLFSIDNDLVYNLQGRIEPKLWRSLGTVGRASSLGDVVAVKTGLKGRISIAGDKIMHGLKADRQVAHYGYEGASNEANFTNSKLKYSPRIHKGEIIRCLEHECTEMVPGFSGSPAMIRHHGKYYAVGIVSKTHDRSSSTFFSVPVSEMKNLKRRWEE